MIKQGDVGPEGLIFIAAKDSPNAQPLLVVGNEVSGSTAVYQIKLKKLKFKATVLFEVFILVSRKARHEIV